MNKKMSNNTNYKVKAIYIKGKYMPLWKEFIQQIKKDPQMSIKKVVRTGSRGGTSFAIVSLIYNYVMTRNPNFVLNEPMETSDDINDENESDLNENDNDDIPEDSERRFSHSSSDQ